MYKTMRGVTVKDATKGLVEAVFSTFNVIDKDRELTLPGAIKDGTEVVISAYGHESHWGKLPVGKGVLRTTETEAIMEGQFFMGTTAGRETFEVVKELGELQEWSYSLDDVTRKLAEAEGQRYWILEDIGLIKEVSPVLQGAGINTRTLSAKGLKFSEEGTAVVAAVNAYLDRATEVMVLRSEKGRGLSDDSIALLKELDEALTKTRGLLNTDAAPAAEEAIPEDVADAVKAAHAAHMRRTLFSALPEGA
jgi:hypothetical protein